MKRLLLIFTLVLMLTSCGTAGDPLAPIVTEGLQVEGDATLETLRLKGQTVSKPPFIIDKGELLSVPQAGTMEYDGTGIYLTNTNHRRFISQAADSIIAPVSVVNSVVETTVFTGVLNANELKVHRVYRLYLFGELSTASAVDTLTMKINANGTNLVTITAAPGVVTNDPMRGMAIFTIRNTGEAGSIATYADIVVGNKEKHKNTSSVAVNTEIINNLIVSFEWSAADPGNIMTLDQAFLEVLD